MSDGIFPGLDMFNDTKTRFQVRVKALFSINSEFPPGYSLGN